MRTIQATRTSKWITLMCIAAALTGCNVGPSAVRAPNAASNGAAFVTPQGAVDESVDIAEWWKSFGDETTDALVARALAHNNDLRAAGASVLEARALLGVAQGQRLPQVGFNAGRTRDQNSFTLPGGRVQVINSTYSVSGNVTWQADLFGKLRRQQEGAGYDLAATQANLRAVKHTIIAETVRARVQVATLHRLLAIARANTANFRKVADIIEARRANGIATATELYVARENLLASEAREPEIERQLRSAQLALDVLVGRQPGTGDDPGDTLGELPPVAQPAVGLPAALLDRRPDLAMAEFRHFAEIAGEGVAVADLLPDFAVTASGGWRADRPRDLFDMDSLVWSLISEVAWKVWAGGSLRAQVDASRARVERTAAEYAQAVLVAMKEVEEALVREDAARRTYDHRVPQVDAARQAEDSIRANFGAGVSDLLLLLETEQRRLAAENSQVLDQQELWNARIDLFLALGGDWAPGAGEPTLEPPPLGTNAPLGGAEPQTDHDSAAEPEK